MNNNRRDILKKIGALTAGASLLPLLNEEFIAKTEAAVKRLDHLSQRDFARDEDFWFTIQKAYRLTPHFINLESGWFSQQPAEVIDALAKKTDNINRVGSFYYRRKQDQEREDLRKLLAKYLGCGADELAIMRNTTEALNNIIFGIEMKSGNEALFASYEYPSMKEQFKMREKRFGIKNIVMDIPLPHTSDRDIVKTYEKNITDRTKVILISHMTYLSGQILPVKEVCKLAHERGIDVIVDGAHSVSHVNYKIPDLGGDYYGASLHKWTGAPIGTGVLYIRKDKIKDVWPMFGDVSVPVDDIRKFEHMGTRPCSIEQTIANAIRFNKTIGLKRKEARLRYLKNYWAEKVKGLPNVYMNTPLEEHRSCGLANVGVKGRSPAELVNYLFDKHKIFTVAIDYDGIHGARIAPNIYTTLNELDTFVEAMKQFCKS